MTQPPRARNSDVARLLEEIGDLLEIKGEQGFRVNAYRSAARRIEGLREPIEQIHAEKRLRSIQGVGPALEQKIGEFLDTGSLGYIEKLRAEMPAGVAQLLTVPGLGPRTARLIYDQLGVASLVELEAAARAGRLRDVSGLGARTEERILAELERLKQRSGGISLGYTSRSPTSLSPQLGVPGRRRTRRWSAACGGWWTRSATSTCWSRRRGRTTCARFVHGLGHVREVVEGGKHCAEIVVRRGVSVDVRVVEPSAWGAALIYHTGSVAHVSRLQALAAERGWSLTERGLHTDAQLPLLAGASEDEIYDALGLQPVPPELREDWGEIELAQRNKLPRLIELADLKGDLHVHSDWSDGGGTIEEMARAAMALGREYIALTDHSKSLGVARGLTDERVLEQRRVLDALNERLAPFRILHGTEMDIKRDGTLDYDDETLAVFDYVSASIHSAMNQEQGR